MGTVTRSFFAGQPARLYRAGQQVDPSDPVLDGRRHLIEDAAGMARNVPSRSAGPPPQAGPGSSRQAWAMYADGHGVEVGPEMSRDDIVGAVAAAGVDV